MSRRNDFWYLFDFAGYDRWKFGSQPLRLLEGRREAAQIRQSLHAGQTRSLFIRCLCDTQQQRFKIKAFWCFIAFSYKWKS